MTTSNGEAAAQPLYAALKLRDDFEVVWAGVNPLLAGFCFGFEDGRLVFVDESGQIVYGPEKGSQSGEAVNGVAGIDRADKWLAVSSRAEVTFWGLPQKPEDKTKVASFPHGAHGVIATPAGSFVAALGRTGFMIVKPPFGPRPPVTISAGLKGELNFYRLVSLRSDDRSELLVCAGRKGGIGIIPFEWGQNKNEVGTIRYPNMDVVDVCSLAPGSLAVGAVSRDGEIVLVRDVLQDKLPVGIKFEQTEGTAYRVLCSQGDLFLLTSKGLHVLSKLAERFVRGESLDRIATSTLTIPMEVVDANIVNDKWLLVLTPDEVRRFDLDVLRHQSNKTAITAPSPMWQPSFLAGAWEEEQMEQKMELTTVG